MLVKRNYQDKNKSIYKCDKCKRKLMINTKYTIYIKETDENRIKKIWDLCENDYESIKKFIFKRYSQEIKE